VRSQSAHVVAGAASPSPCRASRHHGCKRKAWRENKTKDTSCLPSPQHHSAGLPSKAGNRARKHHAAKIKSKQPDRTQANQSRIMDVANTPTGFSSLPVEIKERIYEYTMLIAGHFKVALRAPPYDRTKRYHPCFPNLPSMYYINKVECSIAALVLLRNSVLYLSQPGDTTIFLKWNAAFAVPENKFFTAIKKLHLTYRPPLGNGLFIESLSFAARCPVLVDLTIAIPFKEWLRLRRNLTMAFMDGLMKGDWSGMKNVGRPVMVLAQADLKFGLAAVSRCTSSTALQRLTLHTAGFPRRPAMTKHFLAMAEWFRNALEQENGKVIVVEIL
jgi:hypothetical protein